MLSSPQAAVGEMLVLALVLERELGLVCELAGPFEPFVSEAGTGSVLVSALPQQQVVMVQQAVGAHRLRMRGGPDWDQRAPLLEQLAVGLSRWDSSEFGQPLVLLCSSRLVVAPHSSSCDPCHGSKSVPDVRLSGQHLQGEARSVCLALAEEGPEEEYLKKALDPCLGILLGDHAACCPGARWESMVFLEAVAG